MLKQKKRFFRKNFDKFNEKPKLIKTDREKEFFIEIFQKILNNNSIEDYSRNRSFGAVFAERFYRTIRDLLKRPNFEKGYGNWVDILATITKQYSNRTHISTNSYPINGSLKKNEGFVYKNLLDKPKEMKPEFQVNNLFRTANTKKTFSKGDTTIWSYKLYKTTEIINDTIPSSRIDNLKEKYNESLLKKTELALKENKNVMKALNLN